MDSQILVGDCLQMLRTVVDRSIHCCVTSPPYFGLRDYGVAEQIGLEKTPDEYVAKMVAVFREVRRVLRDDGTLWLNLGDSYNAYNGGAGPSSSLSRGAQTEQRPQLASGYGLRFKGLKPKDLMGIPWRVAFALQADGWYLRQDIIWHKPNPMPESVCDRCTKAHEYIFLMSKSERYYYDQDAIKVTAAFDTDARYWRGRSDNHKWSNGGPGNQTIAKSMDHMRKSGNKHRKPQGSTANRRSVWTVATKPYKGAHFATFPTSLIEPCIKAGCPAGGVVLDPFGGSGTTGQVANALGRRYVLIEINPEYVEIIKQRVDTPLRSKDKRGDGKKRRKAISQLELFDS